MRICLSLLALAGLCGLSTFHSRGDVFQEDFSSAPSARGWRVVGQTNLFSWNATNQNLEVTWDSSQTNSYFCHSLGTILAAEDDFSLSFDLRLNDVAVGVNTNKPYQFELAIGLLNLSEATRTNFFRGAGTGTPDFVEFDYFPDDGIDPPSLDATLSDTNSIFGFYWADLPLSVGETYRVNLDYTASNQTVQAWLTLSNAPYTTLTNSYLSTAFSDFRLDHVAICSYSDASQPDPTYAGSLLAHGVMDNLVVIVPPPPVTNLRGGFSNGVWEVQFVSRSNWLYTLERTVDFQSWTATAASVAGNGGNLVLQDNRALSNQAFYRVRANRP